MFRTIAIALALVSSAPAMAQSGSDMSVVTAVFVERSQTDANGQTTVTVEPAERVVPGDTLLYTAEYRYAGGQSVSNFVLNNPIQREVRFVSADDKDAEVSVDGGQTFGQLADLTVANEDGTRRPAEAGDVTGVRWRIAQVGPGESGKRQFRGVVR